MTAEESLYQDSVYKKLKDACDKGDKAEIMAWYAQLEMSYGSRLLEQELGTAEYLIALHC